MKKVLSLLIVLAMVLAMVPAVFAAPVVTISDDVTVKEGEVASFTVTTTGTGNISYVWYYRENSAKGWKFANETGKNSSTLMVTASRANNGYQYCCVVTDANGKTTSAPATLNVEVEPLAVIDQTRELTVSSGDIFSLNVKVNDPNVKYRWYGRGYGNEYWRFPAGQGVVSDTLTATATGLYAKYEYMCRITDKNGNYVDSEIITVNISDPEELAFTKQPTDVSAKVGDQVVFYVYTTGAVRLQWYYKTATSNWAFVEKCPGYVSGDDTYKLTMDVTEKNIGYQFTCQITGSDGVTKLTADTATLTLRDDLAIVTGPQDVTAEAGETVQFTIDAKGVSKYQWYRRTSATANWGFASEADGAKTSTLNVTATESMDGYQYCCVIQDVDGLKITSDPATLTVGAKVTPLEITGQPEDLEVKAGEEAVFSIKATGDGLEYQWQIKNDDGAWADIDGATEDTLTVTAVADAEYRCVVSDANGQQAESAAAKLTVDFSDVDIEQGTPNPDDGEG